MSQERTARKVSPCWVLRIETPPSRKEEEVVFVLNTTARVVVRVLTQVDPVS